MEYLILLQANPKPELPIELFWGLISLLVGLLAWVVVKYINRLDTILDRLDTAVEGIQATLKLYGHRLDNNENEIKALKGRRK